MGRQAFILQSGSNPISSRSSNQKQMAVCFGPHSLVLAPDCNIPKDENTVYLSLCSNCEYFITCLCHERIAFSRDVLHAFCCRKRNVSSNRFVYCRLEPSRTRAAKADIASRSSCEKARTACPSGWGKRSASYDYSSNRPVGIRCVAAKARHLLAERAASTA